MSCLRTTTGRTAATIAVLSRSAPRHDTSRTIRTAVAGVALVTALAACGGGDSEPDLGEANGVPIAGLWDSTYVHYGKTDAGMIHITPGGLHTLYDYKGDDFEAWLGEEGRVGDCYRKAAPVQLVDQILPEGTELEGLYASAESPDNFLFQALVIDGGTALDWRWPRPLLPARFSPPPGHRHEHRVDQVFPAVVGIDVTDLTPCDG